MFDSDILHWQTFWEQFSIAIHDRANMSDTEKLVYLHHSLKDCSARSVIEGLSRSGEQYAEAINPSSLAIVVRDSFRPICMNQ